MHFEHTPGLTRALHRAQAWSKQQDQDEVLPEHLLRGLLEDEDARPSSLLAEAGLQRQVLVDLYFPSPLPGDSPENLPLSEATRDLLIQAQHLAHGLSGEATLASDHVLLTLLNLNRELRARLESLGLDFARLEQTIAPPPPVISSAGLNLNLLEPPEDIDAARILDASANRSREALRVLEDHCRFVLNDAFLSRQLKQLRHDLAELMGHFPERLLLEARDTLHDVGTTLSTAQERERSSPAEVLQVNARRLQEALRSLEEFSKIFSPELGQAFERIRYQSYTLETRPHARKLRSRSPGQRPFVCAGHGGAVPGQSVWNSVRGHRRRGADHSVAREGIPRSRARSKRLAPANLRGSWVAVPGRTDRDLLKLAREVRRMTREAGVLFIVNDRPDIARLAEADGVHLGQDDMPLADARRIVGGKALIGVSTHNIEQVRRAVLEGASYLGVGPTFPSRTKTFAEIPGLDFARQALAETSLPAFVLGGVDLDNLSEVLALGCNRVAVSHAICAAENPRQVAALMRRMLQV